VIPQTPEEIVDMVWNRYDTDPLFHARVYKAAQVLKTEIQNTGMPWSRSFDGVITAACATGLMMADIHDAETGEFIEFHGEAERVTSGGERLVGPEPTDQDTLYGDGTSESDQHQNQSSSGAP
jgi:hypothetical protein